MKFVPNWIERTKHFHRNFKLDAFAFWKSEADRLRAVEKAAHDKGVAVGFADVLRAHPPGRRPREELGAIREWLRGVPLCDGMANNILDTLAQDVTIAELEHSTPLFCEGDWPDGVHIFLLGRVAILKQDAGSDLAKSRATVTAHRRLSLDGTLGEHVDELQFMGETLGDRDSRGVGARCATSAVAAGSPIEWPLTWLVRLSSEVFSLVFKPQRTITGAELEAAVRFLRALPFFEHWQEAGLRRLASTFRKESHRTGARIARRGEAATVRLITAGEVVVIRRGGALVMTLSAPDIFGLEELWARERQQRAAREQRELPPPPGLRNALVAISAVEEYDVDVGEFSRIAFADAPGQRTRERLRATSTLRARRGARRTTASRGGGGSDSSRQTSRAERAATRGPTAAMA